jgi:hypothetical protein
MISVIVVCLFVCVSVCLFIGSHNSQENKDKTGMGSVHSVSVPWKNELKFKLNKRGYIEKCSQLAL